MTDPDLERATPGAGAPGLRERKRVALRRRLQAEAFRLFETRGYERTTVEAIVDAADTSTTTFYRYFPAKEDLVLEDEVAETIEAEDAGLPRDEPLEEVFRSVARAAFAPLEDDREFHVARLRLTMAVPALAAHYARNEWLLVLRMGRIVAAHTGLDAEDFRVQLASATVTAAVFTAVRHWANAGGATSVLELINRAIDAMTPSVSALFALPDRHS